MKKIKYTSVKYQSSFYNSQQRPLYLDRLERYVGTRERLILRFVDLRRVEKILDAGCGEGIFERYFFQKYTSKVYGIDISKKNILKCRKTLPSGKFLVGDIHNIPFPDNFFDLVFINAVLHHIEEIDVVLREIKRVLRRNGFMIIIEPNRFNPFYLILSLLKTHERGLLHLNMRIIFEKIRESLRKAKMINFNSYFFPYINFPPKKLHIISEFLESFLPSRGINTHYLIVAQKNG